MKSKIYKRRGDDPILVQIPKIQTCPDDRSGMPKIPKQTKETKSTKETKETR